jgi:hypothetical protein
LAQQVIFIQAGWGLLVLCPSQQHCLTGARCTSRLVLKHARQSSSKMGLDSEFYIFDVSEKAIKQGRITGKNTTIDIANLRAVVYILLV